MKIPFRRKKQESAQQLSDDVYVRLPEAVIVRRNNNKHPQVKPSIKQRVLRQQPQPEQHHQPVIKPFVYSSNEELESVTSGKPFQEKQHGQGIKTDGNVKWDKERIRAMLIETDSEKLPMLTVTRKGEFSALVRAATFDEVARMGQHRDLRKDSFVSRYIHNRDVRAPSAFPEEGDSRKELMKQLEYWYLMLNTQYQYSEP